MTKFLPVADEREVEAFHGLSCADEELAVVLDLHKWGALFAEPVLLLSGKELGLWFFVIVEVEIRVSFLGRSAFLAQALQLAKDGVSLDVRECHPEI